MAARIQLECFEHHYTAEQQTTSYVLSIPYFLPSSSYVHWSVVKIQVKEDLYNYTQINRTREKKEEKEGQRQGQQEGKRDRKTEI